MKKLLALALAIVMMLAIALPVFAAETTHYGEGNDDSDEVNYLTDADDTQTDKTTELFYGVAQAYIVSIPANLQLHEADDGYVYNNQTIAVDDVVIAANEELNIYMSNTSGAWKLVDENKGVTGNEDVTYFVTVDGYYDLDAGTQTVRVIDNADDDVAGIALNCPAQTGNIGTDGSDASAVIYFASKGTAQEGEYYDTITFTVKIEAKGTFTA